MLTDPEVKRWASQMLLCALRGDADKTAISQQITLLREKHGAKVVEVVLEELLIEAGRLGPMHSDGSLYQENKAHSQSNV